MNMSNNLNFDKTSCHTFHKIRRIPLNLCNNNNQSLFGHQVPWDTWDMGNVITCKIMFAP